MASVGEMIGKAAEPFLVYLTPANVSMGVAALLGFAGFVHALPGPLLKIQAKQMGMPGWFLMCAGLLMLGSSALYYLRPGEGLYAVSLCMGGAVATAAKMPDIMHRPGGMVFSNLTLAAALWASYKESGKLSAQTCVICAKCYLAGIAGRVFVPGNATLAKLLDSKKKEEPAPKPSEPEKKDAPAAAAQTGSTGSTTASAKPEEGAEKMPQKPDTSAGGARKRVASPVPPPLAK
mmetsp:Transcript_14115/g.40344  ORF Transcript_14115/g.40344 Transcript_14115/m.40344 type:complete len:234 (-) Transcript_14115:403-1104(-)